MKLKAPLFFKHIKDSSKLLILTQHDLARNKDMIHYVTFLQLYKCFSFRKQRAVDRHDGKALSWKTGKFQYCVSLEIRVYNSNDGSNGSFVLTTLYRPCWACSMQALSLKCATPALSVRTKFMLCVSTQEYGDKMPKMSLFSNNSNSYE